MMKHSDSDDDDCSSKSDPYPPPFSLDGGLLSTLRGENRQDSRTHHRHPDDDVPAEQKVRAVSEETTVMTTTDNNATTTATTAIMMIDSDDNEGGNDNSNNNNDGDANADQNNTETTVDAALLLASVAEIASKELIVPSPPPPRSDDETNNIDASSGSVWTSPATMTAEAQQPPPPLVSPNNNNSTYQTEYQSENNNNRARAVSITSPAQLGGCSALGAPPSLPFETNYRVVGSNNNNIHYDSDSPPPPPPPSTPPPPPELEPLSPHCAGRRPRAVSESSIHVGGGVYRDLTLSPGTMNISSLTLSPGVAAGNDAFNRHNQSASARLLAAAQDGQQGNNNHPRGVKMILRKKFSWKNYPELEAFLIANREEYLRHSTLNYTVQQKQYNNRLTERMLELASEHGYVFDEHDFSFVTVRDRIRCYYKSYVQSLKKRGVLIGYAARKAGLVSEVELERSAAQAGTIYIPQS